MSSSSSASPAKPHGHKSVKDRYSGQLRLDKTKVSTIAYGISGKPKLLTYDLKVLVRYGGIITAFTRGTILMVDDGILKLGVMMSFAFITICVILWFLVSNPEDLAELDTSGLESLATYMNGFVPFVLGLYVSLAISRWWALRVQALGSLFDSVTNVAMLVSCVLPRPEHEVIRENVVKWGMASIFLLVKAARAIHNIDDMEKKGFLSSEELKIIAQASPYGRAMVMWAWIMRICQDSFTMCGGPPPHAPKVVAVFNLCIAARNGIQTIHTYLQTQLPFAYVHLITLLVNVNNAIICVKCAVVFIVAFAQKDNQTMIYQILMFVLVPILYQGLLSISYVIHDPFGEDMLDFPIAAFAEYVAESCDAVMIAQENFPWEPQPLPQSQQHPQPSQGGPVGEPVPEPATNSGPVVESMREVGALIASELSKITAQVERLQSSVAAGEARRVQDAERLCSTVLKARNASNAAAPARASPGGSCCSKIVERPSDERA